MAAGRGRAAASSAARVRAATLTPRALAVSTHIYFYLFRKLRAVRGLCASRSFRCFSVPEMNRMRMTQFVVFACIRSAKAVFPLRLDNYCYLPNRIGAIGGNCFAFRHSSASRRARAADKADKRHARNWKNFRVDKSLSAEVTAAGCASNE